MRIRKMGWAARVCVNVRLANTSCFIDRGVFSWLNRLALVVILTLLSVQGAVASGGSPEIIPLMSAGQCVKSDSRSKDGGQDDGVLSAYLSHIGILIHPLSVAGDLGVEQNGRYVPFVRHSDFGIIPMIRTADVVAEFGLPCDPWNYSENYPAIMEYPSAKFFNTSNNPVGAVALSGVQKNVSYEPFVLFEVSASWLGQYNKFPVVNVSGTPKKIQNLQELVMLTQSKSLPVPDASMFRDVQKFDVALSGSLLNPEIVMPMRVDGGTICAHQKSGCIEQQTAKDKPSYIAGKENQLTGVTGGQPLSGENSSLNADGQNSEGFPLSVKSAAKGSATLMLKLYLSREACIQDKTSNFHEDPTNPDGLQKVLRANNHSNRVSPDTWAMLTDGKRKLGVCTQGLLEDEKVVFSFNNLGTNLKRKIVIWAPREGFNQDINGVRYGRLVKNELIEWLKVVKSMNDLEPITVVKIETSGAAVVFLEGEDLQNLTEGQIQERIDEIDLIGTADRALRDLSSVNTLLNDIDFDQVLYIVDSRNEAFNIEDTGVASRWESRKHFSLVNMGQCKKWYQALDSGPDRMSCVDLDNFQAGLKHELTKLLAKRGKK